LISEFSAVVPGIDVPGASHYHRRRAAGQVALDAFDSGRESLVRSFFGSPVRKIGGATRIC